MKRQKQRKPLSTRLMATVAIGALLTSAVPAEVFAASDNTGQPVAASLAAAQSADTQVDELNQYYLRLMTQIFDGSQDFSHTQVAGFGRVRKDNQSLTLLDFGDGAVVISNPFGVSASGFANTSGTELGVVYNYDSKTIEGTTPLAKFHNEFVRPQLDRAPELGVDASWATTVPSEAFGIEGLTGAGVEMNLSRQYFEHDGKPMVLVEYKVPALSYNTPGGKNVIHWGRGFALTDPGFGMIYANVALHRSTAAETDGSQRPYRFYRASFASDNAGKPMIDIAKIPQVAAIYESYFSKQALEVIPYSDDGVFLDQTPISFAANLDIMAMAIGENGANDNAVLAAAQTKAKRGKEQAKPAPTSQIPAFGKDNAGEAIDAVGAPAYNGPDKTNVPPGAPELDPVADEPLDQKLGNTTTVKSKKGLGLEPISGPIFDENGKQIVTREGDARGGTGGGDGGQGTGGGGGGGGTVPPAENVNKTGETLEKYRNYIDKATAIAGGAVSTIDSAERLAIGEAIISLNRSAEQIANKMAPITTNITRLKNAYFDTVDDLKKAEKALNDYLSSGFPKKYSRIGDLLVDNPNAIESAKYRSIINNYDNAFQDMQIAESVLKTEISKFDAIKSDLAVILGQRSDILSYLQKLPTADALKLLEQIGNSRVGQLITKASHLSNAYTVGVAANNIENTFDKNLATGNLQLTRSYSSGSDIGWFGLDILALWGNAASGNVPGFASDAAALLSGTVGDLFIAGAALSDIYKLNKKYEQRNDEQHRARIDQLKKKTEESTAEEAKKMAELKANPAGLYKEGDPYKDGYDTQNPYVDPVTGRPLTRTQFEYMRRHNRGELIRLGINPDAPFGHVGPWPVEDDPAPPAPKIVIKPKPIIIKATANEELNYPTAPKDANLKRPVKISKTGDIVPAVDPAKQAELDREARKAQAKADLEAYQAKRLAERKAEEVARLGKTKGGPFKTSDLKVSSFDVQPISFGPVIFSGTKFDEDEDLFERNPDGTTRLKKVGPDDFKSPTFVGPEFSAPKTSGLGWTNFDDDDYPGSGEVPAYGYESMSGIIATDLSRWEEWLATQDIRNLERLARTAGYPNLASALNDAANLIRLSQDKGYAAWAYTPPSCGGYVGCGPSYSERWGMKLSTVKLGNILNQSRDVFSTGGLSDIAISREVLNYMLRDFGLQDGDIVDVLIQQFGREIFRGRVNLTNGGEAFNILLRRGVAVLTLTAVNEGFASPNTAEINIQEVTKGNARQTYSLRTGESATLRIETNKPAEN